MTTHNPQLEEFHQQLAISAVVQIAAAKPDLAAWVEKGYGVLVSERRHIPEDIAPYIPAGDVVAILVDRGVVGRTMKAAGHEREAMMLLGDKEPLAFPRILVVVLVAGLCTITDATLETGEAPAETPAVPTSTEAAVDPTAPAPTT